MAMISGQIIHKEKKNCVGSKRIYGKFYVSLKGGFLNSKPVYNIFNYSKLQAHSKKHLTKFETTLGSCDNSHNSFSDSTRGEIEV